MKNIQNNPREKGFTLIELLVVIAIIGLLSSIVLASMKGARDQARAKAFRAEVNQYVTALELYRNDKGSYPGQSFLSQYPFYGPYVVGGTNYQYNLPTNFDLRADMLSYIKKLPTIPEGGSDIVLMYSREGNSCVGDTKIPPYTLYITAAYPGFEDWPLMNGAPGYRCFSLK